MTPNKQFEKLRKVKYAATWKPVKDFELRQDERLWRLKLNDWRAFAKKMEELETSLKAAGHDMRIGVFYPLVVEQKFPSVLLQILHHNQVKWLMNILQVLPMEKFGILHFNMLMR